MTVYVDDLFFTHTTRIWPYRHACHMFVGENDNLEDLHRFAVKLGLKRRWFQDRPGFPHYDITASRRVKALEQGAKKFTREDHRARWLKARNLKS